MMDMNQVRYFGSLLEFTQEGIEDFKEYLAQQFENPDDVPFIGYDAEQYSFYTKASEFNTLRIIVSSFDAYIKFKSQKSAGFDILSDEPFKPIECTILPSIEEKIQTPATFGQNDLIVIDDDSDEESSDNTSSVGVPSAYWCPENGDIGILPDSIARDLATLTDCMLYKEPNHHRVRLMNGDTSQALQKLKSLEKLLTRLASHREAPGDIVHQNLLRFSSQLPGVGVRYGTIKENGHAQRVLVNLKMEPYLDGQFIGEEYLYEQGQYRRSPNLTQQNNGKMALARSSILFASIAILEYGNESFGLPQRPSKSSGSDAFSSTSVTSPPQSETRANFMPLMEQAKVREWQLGLDKDTDESAVRESLTGDMLTAEQQPSARRVLEDSDSDAADAQAYVPRRIVSDSDSDSSPQREPIHTMRRMAQESDSDEDVQPEMPPTSPMRSKPQTRHRTKNGNEPVDTSSKILQTATQQQPGMGSLAPTAFWRNVPRDDPNDQEQPCDGPNMRYSGESPDHSSAVQDQGTNATSRQGSGSSSQTTNLRSPSTNMHLGARNQAQLPTVSGRADAKLDATRPSRASNKSDQQGTERDRDDQKLKESQARQATGLLRNQEDQPAKPSPKNHPPGLTLANRNDRAQLLDIPNSMDKATSSTRPPPGFDYQMQRSSGENNVDWLEGPLDQIQRASLKPTRVTTSSDISEDGRHSISGPSKPSHKTRVEYNSRPEIIRPNTNDMSSDMLQQLYAAGKRQNLSSRSARANSDREQIEANDEMSSRQFLSSMNLQAPNPGPSRGKKGKGGGKGGATQETAAEKAQRIAKQKAELGVPGAPLSGRPLSNTKTQIIPDQPSQKLKKAARENQHMAATQTEMLSNTALDRLVSQLHPLVHEALETASFFPGKIQLLFRLGQLLVEPTMRMRTRAKIMELPRWIETFVNDSNKPRVTFTQLLTNDGADLDSIIGKTTKLKMSKTWKNEHDCETILEFQCVDNAGFDFKIVFNLDGSHYITGPVEYVNKVGIHCPGRVWDICATLGGRLPWKCLPEHLEAPISELLSTVYVRTDPRFSLFFRLPVGNTLFVRDVTMQRTSLHDCQESEFETCQLQLTEVTQLDTKSHRLDKRLHTSTVKSHDSMVEENKIHYEVALADKELEAALQTNHTVQLGHQTGEPSLASSLFTTERCRTLLQKGLQLVDKMDWVGKQNFGTLHRQQEEREMRVSEFARANPLNLSSHHMRPVLGSGLSIAGPRSTRIGETVDSQYSIMQPVHGVRAGTQAPLYQDAQGNRFRYGQGAARIPVVTEEDANNRTELGPDDSASQSGHPQTPRRIATHDDKPPGFW